MKLGDRVKTRYGKGIIVAKDLLKHDSGQWWYIKLDWQNDYENSYHFMEREMKRNEN